MGDGPSSVTSVVKEGSLMWPLLPRSNYSEWAMLMQCNFEALEIWETIEPGGVSVKRAQDRQAMSACNIPKFTKLNHTLNIFKIIFFIVELKP